MEKLYFRDSDVKAVLRGIRAPYPGLKDWRNQLVAAINSGQCTPEKQTYLEELRNQTQAQIGILFDRWYKVREREFPQPHQIQTRRIWRI